MTRVGTSFLTAVSLWKRHTTFHSSRLGMIAREMQKGPHRIRRHDAQVKLLARDLAKAARHPVVEERSVGRHRERPDIRALGRSGGTELFNVTICNFLSHNCSTYVLKSLYNPLNEYTCRIFPESQPGKGPGRGRKSAEFVEGGMDGQSFYIRRHAPSGRNTVQPATCSVVNTRWLAPGRS